MFCKFDHSISIFFCVYIMCLYPSVTLKYIRFWCISVWAILQEEKSRKTKNLLDEIKLAVAGKAKAGGYTLVLDADAVLFTSGESDITDVVLAQLNVSAPAELARPEVKKDEPKK